MAMAAERWRRELAGWAIPDHILAQAVEPPWGFPVELFSADEGPAPDTVSRRRAAETLPTGGSVLDVGCGGGAAGLALVPPAGLVVGVDESAEMLEAMRQAAQARGVEHATLQARWPDGAAEAPMADVVVCHHVAYNVPDLAGFAVALAAHARRRVVMVRSEAFVTMHRRRLCLPPEREPEVAAAMGAEAGRLDRQLATLWWDT
jgi:SAM-dependent methyltransferase